VTKSQPSFTGVLPHPLKFHPAFPSKEKQPCFQSLAETERIHTVVGTRNFSERIVSGDEGFILVARGVKLISCFLNVFCNYFAAFTTSKAHIFLQHQIKAIILIFTKIA